MKSTGESILFIDDLKTISFMNCTLEEKCI
jgi:hypothetical protein